MLLFFLGCLSIPENDNEEIAELEQRTKNLEDSIVGLLETGITFLNSELRNDIKSEKLLRDKEEVEYDYLASITGVWSDESLSFGTTVFEINFIDKLKTLKYIYTPSDLDRRFNDSVDINYLYDISIKKIDDKKHTVSFYLTKKGKGFKKPMRKNPIWTVRLNPINDSYITLTTNKGKKYKPDYVREY